MALVQSSESRARAQKVCSAAPAIPDLQLTVEELFGEEVPDNQSSGKKPQ